MRILILLLLLTTTVWAATSTEVVELRYRSAADLIQVIQPHLGSSESVSGLDNKLVLRLDAANRQAILDLIHQLDKRPSQLLVSVRQAADQQSSHIDAGVSGRYRTGKGSVQVGNDDRPLSGRIIQHQTKSDTGNTQQVRVMDGQPASFQVGQLVPVPGGSAHTPDGFILHEGIYYQEVVTGFYVRPRITGERVRLEVSPQQQSLQSDGSIAVQSVNTIIEGRLGEWLDIGQVVEDFNQNQSGLLSYGNIQGRNRSRVEVKVDVAP